jgi:DNA replication protein DnaC
MTRPTDVTQELVAALRRLKLGKMLDTLPERLTLARQQKLSHRDFLLVALQDEIARRDQNAVTRRAARAHLDPDMMLERWDDSADVSFDRDVLSELVSLAFIDEGLHVLIVGPVGVGKTFLAHAIGHMACRRGLSVIATSVDRVLKTLRHARLDNSHELEMRKLVAVDLLILDDFALDAMDVTESRDISELLTERHRAGSVIVTSNRGPDEWLATFADPIRAQSTIDRFANKAYDLVIEGESYRPRQKPRIQKYSKATRSEHHARNLREH